MPCGMLAGIYSLVVCAMVGLIAGCLQPPTNRDATAAQPVGSAPGQNTGTPGGGGTGTPGLSRTVAVVDDFFDLNSKVLSGKILAAYKLKCVESGSGSDVTSEDIDSMSVEALKSRLIAAATTPVNCSLLQLDPFDYNASGFTNIESSRDSWNQGILTKQGENLSEEAITQLEKVIEGPSGLYHGTATAGLVAYQNPGVKLVLIQVELSSSSEAEGKAVCHAQQTMNNLAQAYRDTDVIKATISAPRSAITDQLNQIVKQHNITVASQSYGGYSRQKT